MEPGTLGSMATEQQWPGESVWTIVVGGGSGRRFGGPKQYERLGGGRVIDRSRATAEQVSDGVVLVVPPDDALAEAGVPGGVTRTESVRNGLAAVPAHATVVCVHDAARPFASTGLYRAVVEAVVDGADAAVPGVPVTDTIKIIDTIDGAWRVITTPTRDTLVAVQTPQAFRATVLRAAHDAAQRSGEEATDDAALVERSGGVVVVVPGEVDNRKITHPDDLDWARRLVAGADR